MKGITNICSVMGIIEQQNTEPYIELVKAFKSVYSKAKLLGSVRVIVAILSAGIAPFVVVFIPDWDKSLAFIGALCTVICEGPLEALEDNRKSEAARIQEQFDIGLFGISWNKAFAGNQVAPEEIASEARQFNGKQEVKDWYADPGKIPFPLDVLLCQRSSLIWDARQRRHFASIISLLTLLLFVFGVGFSIYKHQSLIDYLLSIFAPSVPALLQGVKAARAHSKNATDKDELVELIQENWDSAIIELSSVASPDCRVIQDRSFLLRKEGPMTPDFWHNHHRSHYEMDMQAAVTKYRQQAEQRYGTKNTSPVQKDFGN